MKLWMHIGDQSKTQGADAGKCAGFYSSLVICHCIWLLSIVIEIQHARVIHSETDQLIDNQQYCLQAGNCAVPDQHYRDMSYKNSSC